MTGGPKLVEFAAGGSARWNGAAALAALTVSLACAAPARAQEGREARWESDLGYMARQLELRHPDLYHTLPRERFRAGVAEIVARLPALSDDGVALALARLLSDVGDGHTLVPLPWDRSLDYGRLPVELLRTADGVTILAADSARADLAGSEVLRIGDLPATTVLDSVETLISRDNPWTTYTRAAEYAGVPEILYGLGISRSRERVRLRVRDRSGTRREIELERVPRDAAEPGHYGAFGDSAPWLGRRDEPYWLALLPGDSIAYVQFNRADRDLEEESLAEFGSRLLSLVARGPVVRIVLDLRWNRGGSRWRARHLLGALIPAEHALGAPRRGRARRPGRHLVTLIGPNTFSAAAIFALDLDLHTNTAFVGLPTGGRPNAFGEVGRFRLPRSGLEIRHSVYYRQAAHPRDTRPAVFPDDTVRWTTADVRCGTDPGLVAALAWRPRQSAADSLARRIDESGVEAAFAWLDSLRAEPTVRLAVSERDLNRLGYRLLRGGRAADAAAVFQRNLEIHPWSANAHDSLADAYLALGREKEAYGLLCRAFAIDPQFTRILERGRECAPDVLGKGG